MGLALAHPTGSGVPQHGLDARLAVAERGSSTGTRHPRFIWVGAPHSAAVFDALTTVAKIV